MSLAAHLVELRRRILWSGAGICLAMIPAWWLYESVVTWLFQPINTQQLPVATVPFLPEAPPTPSGGVNFRSVTAPFTTQLRFAAWGGLLLSSPWWLSQLWLYIAPALTRREKRAFIWAAFPSAVLFTAGATLALTVLPRAVALLLSIAPPGSVTFIDADAYLSFVMLLVVAVAASCVFPVVVVSAHALRLVSVASLVRHWRWFTLGACTFAAVINPLPDAWSMLLQAVILLALHWIAVGVCALRERRWSRT